MSQIVIGVAQSVHDAFMNWISPYVVAGGIGIALLVMATMLVVAFAARRPDRTD